jgi:RND superfamily putative drug exporter
VARWTRFVLRFRWPILAFWVVVILAGGYATSKVSLTVAIFLDVTIVRALLVPSLMALFGRWNWWLPENIARLARVPPSPLVELQPALRPAAE